MAISYKRFVDSLLQSGSSLSELKRRKVISDFAYRLMLNEEPISLKHVDKICQHLNLSIEQVVEIIPDEETPE